MDLLPAQQKALDNLERHARAHRVTSLMDSSGEGVSFAALPHVVFGSRGTAFGSGSMSGG